jgi:hypothetical protein
MSSHREAPEISKDPAADNTDTYAFVTPDAPDTVTIVANYIPFQLPYGGPNFAEFADDVFYGINVSNRGDAQADLRLEFRFATTIRTPSFLYNTGPITNVTDTTWNRPQTYSITAVVRDDKGHSRSTQVAKGLTVPPCNVGTRSIANYPQLTQQAVHSAPGLRKVFAGQRSDPFFADLGSIFDLGALRPFNNLHLIPLPSAQGINGLQGLNVHSIVVQVQISELTRNHDHPADVMSPASVIGVWADATRARSTTRNERGEKTHLGQQVQVSRLGNPLFNEVVVPMTEKDHWNSVPPAQDATFAPYVDHPELQRLLPALYPGVFPNLSSYTKPRADLDAILLTGIPAGIVRGFQNYTGTTKADMLRLNVAVPPSANPDPIGLIAGDPAGFPNGRRLADNIVAIELRAVAGATIPLVDTTYTPDAAAGALTDGTTNTNLPLTTTFPYLADPAGGYQSRPGTPAA